MNVNRSNVIMGEVPPAAIVPPLDRLWSYWLRLKTQGNAPIPAKSEIRISGLGAILPHIVISERLGEDEVMIRLAGTAMEETIGRPLTGMNLLNLTPPSQRKEIANVYTNLLKQPCGFFISESLRADGGKKYMLAALVLPLAAKDGEARFTIGQYAVRNHGFEADKIKSGAVIEHRQIDSFGFIDVGFGWPET
ncbi:PAS domain-containing protein [Kordiimonas gwangyangensis]|uniref:PAS domain-containing protein n=1 Tax=Kordiimonas gwangyangensis TaxID=288022 RepID=UPI0003A08383|nr:PAS domain-containing protein [Kordiimonas gwangyangensis]